MGIKWEIRAVCAVAICEGGFISKWCDRPGDLTMKTLGRSRVLNGFGSGVGRGAVLADFDKLRQRWNVP
jgi:hypothetical protein